MRDFAKSIHIGNKSIYEIKREIAEVEASIDSYIRSGENPPRSLEDRLERLKKELAQTKTGNTNVPPVSKPSAPVKDPKKDDKEKDKDKKPSDPKDEEGYTFKERVKQVTGNSDGTEKLFHSLEKDVEEKEEKNDEEIEKVGNVQFSKGDRVEHPSFGKGTFISYDNSPVTMLEDSGKTKTYPNISTTTMVIKFDDGKERKIKPGYVNRIGNSASDDKFAYVMREFDEGKLKTPDGKVVTDPAQAKAIAYSESKKAENGCARARNAIKK